MASDSEIVKLSAFVSSQVKIVDAYLKAQKMPGLSLSTDAPPVYAFPPEIVQAQSEALAALDDLKALLHGPMENLAQLCNPRMNAIPALQVCLKYEIASHIQLDEEVSYKELSARCHLDEPTLTRIMRMLISMRIFSESRKGFVAHNGSSQLMLNNPDQVDFLNYCVETVWSSGFTTLEALQEWPDAQDLDQTAYCKLTGKSFWDDIKSNKVKAQRFSSAMKFLQNNPALGTFFLLNDLKWDDPANLPSLMVDVGGHTGSVSTDILRRFPTVKSIVQDVSDVVAQAKVPDDLKDRLEIQAHDFFTPQPVVGADVYFLRMVLHDWPDKYAHAILSNLIPALKPGSRIILNESCLPDPGVLPKYHDSMLRGFDLCMKQYYNSKERSMEDWIELLGSCDKRFVFKGANISLGSAFAVIEFVWAG